GRVASARLPCPRPAFPLNPRAVPHLARARSSAGEHYVDIVGVTGSIPVAPTILSNCLVVESSSTGEIEFGAFGPGLSTSLAPTAIWLQLTAIRRLNRLRS